MDTEINFFSSSILENPYEIYKTLRNKSPLYWSEQLQAWLVTPYEDVKNLLYHSNFCAATWSFKNSDTFPNE